MSNDSGHLDILASLFAWSDSDTIPTKARTPRSQATKQEAAATYFGELSQASEDDLDIYGKGTVQDSDDSDDASDTSRARADHRTGD